jgi:large subunit ribosomal protein L21
MMFAIVRFKGRQYRLREGDVVALDKIDADVGSSLELDEVLVAGNEKCVDVGTPVLEGARVTAEVVGHERKSKAEVFKFRRRKTYKKLRGHRQPYTVVKVLSVTKS